MFKLKDLIVASLLALLATSVSAQVPIGGGGGSGGGSTNITAVGGNAVTTTIPVSGTISCTNCSGTGASVNEDTASANLEILAPNGMVQKASPANTAADGDWTTLQGNNGRLYTSTTIDAALPAGTNNIGDVDVLTVPADPFGANADAASATGSISAKLRFIASTGIPVTGTVTVGTHAVTQSGTWTTVGGLTNNNAAPTTTNYGVLPAIANASAPSWTEGRQVLLSTDLSGALRVSGAGGGTQYTHDAALTVASTVGTQAIGRASAAAPTDVSADNDAVLPWYLRNGAQATVLTAAGALIGGDATNGLDVDVTRVTGNVSTNLAQVLGATLSATNPVPVRAADSTGYIADEAAHDAAYGSLAPVGVGGYASAAPCSAVSADGDKVRNCLTRNGALYTQPTDGTNLLLVDPCASVAKTTTAISATADTVIITAAASKKNYICGISVVASAAEVVGIVEGTGSTCGTSTAAIVGSTTDANSMSFAANGGIAANGGASTVLAGTGTNVDTCLHVSGSNRVSGYVTWVQR